MRNQIIFLILCLNILLPLTTQGQMRYTSDRLNLGSYIFKQPYDITIGDMNGLYMKNGQRFFKFDLSGSSPRISSTGGRTTFYNSSYQYYDMLLVKRVYVHSDIRSKKNVMTMHTGLSLLDKMIPLDFSTEPSSQITRENSDENMLRQNYGIDASTLAEAFPELVDIDDNNCQSINYTALIPILINILKDLNTQIDSNQKIIDQFIQIMNNENN